MFIARGTYQGWFHVYGFTALLGVLVPLAVSLWVTHRRRIPLWPIEFGLVIVIVPALMGASIGGKLAIIEEISFFELIAFWQPGMSIYGGIISGGLVGWCWFYFCARRLQISVWVFVDLTLPHFLLGQAIGRWGNFFNHELLGLPTTRDHLAWLPPFIKNNLFKWYIPSPIPDHFQPHQAISQHGGGVPLNQFGQIQYFQPLFLFECLADIGLWIVIVFILPRVWKAVSCIWWRRRHHQTVLINNFYHELYFQITPALHAVRQLQSLMRTHHQFITKAHDRFGGKISLKFNQWWWRWRYRWTTSSPQLEALHNPHQIIVLRSGMVGLSYLAGYSMVRLALTFQRHWLTPPQLMWVYSGLSLLIVFVGVLQLFVQVVSPHRMRQTGWLYEKQY